MYIRRKVFSSFIDEYGEEKYFSTTEFEYDYGYDERYYSDDEDDEKSSRGKKAAIIGGAAAAPVAVVGGYQLARGRRRAGKKWDELNNKVIEAGGLENMGAEAEKINNEMLKASKRSHSNKVDEFGDKIQEGIGKRAKSAGQWIKGKWTGEGNKRIKQVIDEETGKVTNSAYKYFDSKTGKALTQEEANKAIKKIGNRNKALMIATPIVAAGGTIAATKIAKNRRKSDED